MSKPAHSSTRVFSHISIPTPSLGARNDLGSFLLINACLHCNKTWKRKYEAPEAAKLWRQVIMVILHTAPPSSLALRRQINHVFKMVPPSSSARDTAPAAMVTTSHPYHWITQAWRIGLCLTACPLYSPYDRNICDKEYLLLGWNWVLPCGLLMKPVKFF